jgi:vitamin B12 transporter
MKIATTLLTVLLTAYAAVAQEGAGLRGVVTIGGRPAAGATVTVTGPDGADKKVTQTRVTDDQGNYYVGFDKPGNYSVKVVFEQGGQQYEFQLGKPVMLKFAFETKLDIELGQLTSRLVSVPSINETVTVAAGESQTVGQVSKTVDTISAAEMRDRADFSLIESLRTIPGFRVQQSGGFGRLATIKTRGLRNQDTAILIDGIRFRDPTAITGDASPFLGDFTLTSVSEVEVLRGSGSSLYGTNAIGGTIDFRTPEAKIGTHGQIGGALGGLGLARFRGLFSHEIPTGRFGISAGLSRTVYTKGIDGDDDAHNTNFQTRFDASPKMNRTTLSGRIFFSQADVRLNSNPDTAGILPPTNATIINAVPNVSFVPDLNDPDDVQHSRFFSGQFSINQVLTPQLVLIGYYQWLDTKRTNDNGTLGIGFQSASTSIFDGSIHTGNAHLTWTPSGSNTLTAGYEFEREGFGNIGRTPAGTGNFFTRVGQQSHTFYAQDLVSLLDGGLQISGGVRLQRYSLRRPAFSLANAPYGNLALSAPPTALTFDGSVSHFFKRSGTKLRAHVGNGYRVPSLYERFGTFFSTFGTPEFVALGDPFLKPEKTIAFDAGVEQNLAKDRVRLSGTYFWTRLNDIIGFGDVVPNIVTTPRPFGGYENQKGGRARGGEFSLKARASQSTDIFASYTLTDSKQLTPQAHGSGILKTLGIPDHQFSLVVTQRVKRFWVNFDLLATSTYLAPVFDTNGFTFQTYVYRFRGNRKGDLTSGYTFGFKKEKMTLRLYGTIENVFNQEYFENGFRTAKATARAGLTFGF